MKKLNLEKLKTSIESIAKLDIDENNVFGSAYYVMQEGGEALEEYFGVTGHDDGSEIGKDSMFRVASMTKPFTSLAVLVLVDRGLLSLSDPIKKYFPEFDGLHITSEDGEDLGVAKTDITVFHLLTHTSGFGKEAKVKLTEDVVKNVENSMAAHLKEGLKFEPSTKQEYTGYATFDVLVALVEKITGEDFEEFLQENIIKVCNMENTTLIPTEEQWEKVVAMHNKENGKSIVSPTKKGCVFGPFPAEHKVGGAGIVSTLNDYSKFARMLLNRGKVGDKRIVSEKTFDLLPVAYVPKSIMQNNESWGLGVRVIADEAYEYLPVGTIGMSGAYGCHFWVDYENRLVAVFMKNTRVDTGFANMSAQRFEKAVCDALTD